MRIVLSRKGFDSTYGGIPSPIFPDEKTLSLPIPNKQDFVRYSELPFKDKDLSDLIAQLSPSKQYRAGKRWHVITSETRCHLDPDIYQGLKPRPSFWRPLFGQGGQSQSHLDNHKIGKDDLFLFFGWFRRVQVKDHHYKYLPTAPDIHLIYGYFQVDYIVKTADVLKGWMKDHPHYRYILSGDSNDTIFVAREHLSFDVNSPGAGPLKFHPSRVLTKSGYARSKWNLPEYFKNINISYHSDSSWHNDYFQSAYPGQEFVFQESEAAVSWAKKILFA